MRADLRERNSEKYVKARISMLVDDFKINLSETEIKHMCALPTKITVDNFVRDIIRRKL